MVSHLEQLAATHTEAAKGSKDGAARGKQEGMAAGLASAAFVLRNWELPDTPGDGLLRAGQPVPAFGGYQPGPEPGQDPRHHDGG